MQCWFNVLLTALGLTLRHDKEAKSMLLICVQRHCKDLSSEQTWHRVVILLVFLSTASKTFPSNVRQTFFGKNLAVFLIYRRLFFPITWTASWSIQRITFVYSILSCLLMCLAWVNFSNMFMALYCTVEILLYTHIYIYININLFILSISKEMLVLSMSTRTLLTSVQSYQLVWIYYVL